MKLRERLGELNVESKKLLSINRALKDNIEKLSQANKHNTPDQIAYYKASIYDLRITHDRLVEEIYRIRGNE